MLNAMASQNSFMHPQLDADEGSFRVVKIESPCADGIVRCSTLVLHITDTTEYVALSYIWGTDEPANAIVIDGDNFHIRSNLAHFLSIAQHWNLGPIFIDALCINQADINERNEQVKLMGQIYANAQRVISWLGHGNRRVEAAIPFIKQFIPTSNGLLENFYKGKEDNIREAQQIWSSVHDFCALRYWTRIWMVQEILKARAITFVYGDHSIEGEDLSQFSQALRETYPNPAPLADQLFRSRLFSYLDGGRTKPLFKTGSIMQAKLVDVLWEYGLSACGEKRDRVYALLSLAKEGQRFPVDYNILLADLFSQVWNYRPLTGPHLIAFTKHMSEALFDDWSAIDENRDSKRSKIYRLKLEPICCVRRSLNDENVGVDTGWNIAYQLACNGPLHALRTRAWPFFNVIHPQISIRVDVSLIKNQAFEVDDEVFNIENSGLLIVARRDAQNEMRIIAELSLSVGLNHVDGVAEVTARWLPWSSLLEKLRSKHQAYSIEKTNGKMYMCFNEMALRIFLTGISYERHNMQILDSSKNDGFEVDLLTVHWKLPTGEFSLDEVCMLQDICNHSTRNADSCPPLSLLRAVHALTRSLIDLTRYPDSEEEKPLSWRELLERGEGPNGPTTSQLHKLFY